MSCDKKYIYLLLYSSSQMPKTVALNGQLIGLELRIYSMKSGVMYRCICNFADARKQSTQPIIHPILTRNIRRNIVLREHKCSRNAVYEAFVTAP